MEACVVPAHHTAWGELVVEPRGIVIGVVQILDVPEHNSDSLTDC